MVVVTRHKKLVDLLIEEGIVTNSAKVVERAEPEDVAGRVVVGILPLHLAALAIEVIVPVLELRPEDIGRELSIRELRERYKGVRRYVVRELDRTLPTARREWLRTPRHEGIDTDKGVPGIKVSVPIASGVGHMFGQLAFLEAKKLEDVPDPSSLNSALIVGSQSDLDTIEDLWAMNIGIRSDGIAGPFLRSPRVLKNDRVVIDGDGWVPVGLLLWVARTLA